MPVFRIERTRDYTVMSNHHLKNPELSLKAKGLLSMMLSFPDGWNYSERGLASICKEGVDAIHSAIKELESTGYMERHQLRGKGGRIVDTEYVIYEKPHTPDMASPDTENPDMDSPDAAAPEPENPGELNNKKPNTKKSNTQVFNTQSFTPPAPSRGDEDGMTDGLTERAEIRDQIEYESLLEEYSREQVDELVELMLEVQMNRGKSIRLGRDAEFPTAFVQHRFEQIGRDHFEKVLDGIKENTTAVKNTKAYLLSALFNSVSTLDNHYAMRVNHDLYGG
ncbi:MAG: helix-turn-helix domain-containing protein [Clostridia bacterium]|nr:helix-turn-helix domain-containing protein [Clostridia bacterium]